MAERERRVECHRVVSETSAFALNHSGESGFSFQGILLTSISEMEVKPTVALRALLVGGVAAFAKIAAAVKAAGGAKVGAAAAAMTVAATTAMAGSKQEPQDDSKHLAK